MTFREEVMSHEYIYGYMYGRPIYNLKNYRTPEDQIIEIKTKEIEWPANPKVASEEFLFVWGWPGPDYNTYLRKDYGQTWAYTKEELLE